MNWQVLNSIQQIDEIIEESKNNKIPGILIFKHSTICSISAMALSRLERKWHVVPNDLTAYFLDLRKYRDVSNYLEERFNVKHESPQILLIKNGECVYNNSHNLISADSIVENLESKKEN